MLPGLLYIKKKAIDRHHRHLLHIMKSYELILRGIEKIVCMIDVHRLRPTKSAPRELHRTGKHIET